MNIKLLIALSFVCAMGAISPGPSLAVVLRNTISGGRLKGVMTGVGHGIGLGIYAFIAVMGLSSLLLANKEFFNLIQWGGALFLVWLAFNMIAYHWPNFSDEHEGNWRRGFLEGFMIAFLNPKILVFMAAVFSQFINPDTSSADRFIIAIMAGVIDTIWYVLVAAVLAGTPIINKLSKNAGLIDRSIGIIMLLIALFLIVKKLGLELF